MIIKNRQKKKKKSNKGLKVHCDCLKCKNQNLVSISTRTRHRKKFSKSDNIQNELNINKQESSESDENEQDQRSSDAKISDIESPNYEPLYQEFSDKIMSDGENSESSTDDSNSVLNNMQDVSSQDSSEDGDTVQLPPGFPEALRLLEIKAHSNMPNSMYHEIIEAFSEQHVSLYRATKKLSSLVSIDPVWIDCCVKSCCAFTGKFENLQECPTCGEKRYRGNSKSRKKMAFFPLKNRFIIQYQNPSRSLELLYRNNYTTSQKYLQDENYGDIFDGKRYQELVEEGHFTDYRDIALTASLDGYNIFKQKTDDCWIILFINANLKPEDRVKQNNLLIGALIPGPSTPGDLNSFLRPVIDEIKELECGIKCYDGNTNQDFILHCSIVSWSGDTPGLAKLMYTTGHNSYQGCRYCNIRGIWENHIYFPTKPPKNKRNSTYYDPRNLPKRTHQDYLIKIQKWKMAKSNKDRATIETSTGVNGQSILFELKSIKFPDSFPLDIMHLLYENIPGHMLKHWYGCFYSNNNTSLNLNEYTIQKNIWATIGKTMEKNKKSIPASFGRPPRNIVAHRNGFKAEEWANWVVLYSMPLLKEYLPKIIMQGWSLFVTAVKLCQKRIISADDVKEIRKLMFSFYKHYEMVYYRQEQLRLPAMKICFHYLLHLADTIETNGPCWSTWQFPIERLFGMLLPLVQSKLHPYDNLANQIILKERLNHLQFIEHIYQQIHPLQKKAKKYNENIVFVDPSYEEEFYFPTAKHYLNKSMVNKLKNQYLTCYENKIILLQKEFPEYGKKYARMRTQNGHFIGSMWQRKNKDFRINYGIAARMKVDKWAAFKNRAPQFEIQEFYGRVEYYFVHQFNGKTHLMAFVHWTQNVNEDEYGLKFFREFGIKQFIDVRVIDRCIGFLKCKNILFIIDKEVDDPDDSYLDSSSEND